MTGDSTGGVAQAEMKEMEKLVSENKELKEKLKQYAWFNRAFGNGVMESGYVLVFAHKHRFVFYHLTADQAQYKITLLDTVTKAKRAVDKDKVGKDGPAWIEKNIF